jgi:hypothetical protein
VSKKKIVRKQQHAVWFTDPSTPQRVARLIELMQAEMPIKVTLSAGQCVLAAIEEGIARREDKKQ